MFKSLKEKVLNSITAHPKLVTFGIGLAITFVIGTAIGMVDNNQAFAAGISNGISNGNFSP
jgi:hypothetical protein